jgi:hypothetical protein
VNLAIRLGSTKLLCEEKLSIAGLRKRKCKERKKEERKKKKEEGRRKVLRGRGRGGMAECS